MEKVSAEKGIPFFFLLKCLLGSYILTAGMLLVLAFMVYKIKLSKEMVSVVIIAIYVVSTFLGGFIAGKKLQSRKFIWGFMVGIAYFAVLALVSLLINQNVTELGNSVVTTLILCGAGGMMGGMIS